MMLIEMSNLLADLVSSSFLQFDVSSPNGILLFKEAAWCVHLGNFFRL